MFRDWWRSERTARSVALVLNSVFGRSWADRIVALVIAVEEGRQAGRGDRPGHYGVGAAARTERWTWARNASVAECVGTRGQTRWTVTGSTSETGMYRMPG